MRPWLRTLMAFIFAPLVAGIEVAITQTIFGPAGETPKSIRTFTAWVFVASINSYLISYTLGTITFLVLRALRKESFVTYTLIGAAVGGIVGAFAFAGEVEFTVKSFFALPVSLSFFGASVAATFAAIRGIPRNV